jgi:DNA-binding SARP family transcriptional activator
VERSLYGELGSPVLGGEIIRRKLAPPPRPDRLIARPRLERALAAMLERHRVLRICATAGSGKTTLVAEVMRGLGQPVAWLTVDHTDAAPGRLVTYIEAALAATFPAVTGTTGRALGAGLPHVEAVGLLAQAAERGPLVFVFDDLERLGDAADAWAVVESLVRYAPEQMRIVLISRRDLPGGLCRLPSDAALAALGETDLAFTHAEAASALAALDADVADVAEIIESTGGWVTGVLFDAWRSAEHVVGAGGEADPLYGYLSSQILDGLRPDEREFLVVCSLLDEVTAPRAEALGMENAAARLASLRAAHLPVSWTDGWHAMRCHSRFREYLLDQLAQRDRPELHRLRARHGRLLAEEGHPEEATEELLRAGDVEAALPVAEQAIFAVIERLDFAIAERWLARLSEVSSGGARLLKVAELMIAIAQDDLARGMRIADQLAERGEREPLAAASTLAATLMGWCYLHAARLDDLSEVLAAARPGPELDAVRYCAALMIDLDPSDGAITSPSPSGGPLDAIRFAGSYWLGHLDDLMEPPASPFVEAVSRPYRIGALRAAGRTQQALELYEATEARHPGQVALHAAIGPEVLIDAGRLDAAREAVERGRRLALASGSLGYRAVNVTAAMKLALRLERDPAAARAALDELERDQAVRRFHFSAEQQDLWYGFALLLEGKDEAALVRLRRAVAGMRAGGRLLELPTAAVYLAEAEWRGGDEEAADRSADLAFQTARRQGSNHLLLQALADFPAVASRRLDAEVGGDSPWHELGRVLFGQSAAPPALGTRVWLEDLGPAAILVDEAVVNPGLAKSVELLAYVCLHRGQWLDRSDLLGALFDGRADDSARAYVRQATARLRAVLPDGTGLEVKDAKVRLSEQAPVGCASLRLERALAEAARQQGKARLEATVVALGALERGTYLPDADSGWATDRRQSLERLGAEARFTAAQLAYGCGRLTEARHLLEATLESDPYREGAWRLTMQVSSALGDEAAVLRAFQSCERALAELSLTPSQSTRQLLEALRR